MMSQQHMQDLLDQLNVVLKVYGASRLECSHAWFPECHTSPERELVHLAMGTAEEGGEVLGVVKKWHRRDGLASEIDREKLHGEMGDAFVYLVMLGVVTEIDWKTTLNEVFIKCVERWGWPE